MGTRASITVKTRNGVKTIYNHWDGYHDGVGVTLIKHYHSQEKAEALIALGNVSSLRESLECPEGHNFDNRIKGYSTFYERDRGETEQKARSYPSVGAAMEHEVQEFNYFWDGEKWLEGGAVF
jgi:exoribonuclease II